MAKAVEELREAAVLCGRLRPLLHDERLTELLVAEVASFLGAETGCCRALSVAAGVPVVDRVVSVGIPQSVDDAYLTRYHELDPARRLLQRPLGEPMLTHSVREQKWARTQASAAERRCHWQTFLRYRREFLLPNGFYHHVGFCFRVRSGQTLLFDFHRPAGSVSFGRIEEARARIVATYLHGCAMLGNRSHSGPYRAEDGRLSVREAEVAEAVVAGLSNKEVAAHLCISVRTVENHMRSIFSKLGVTTRTRLAAKLQSSSPASS